MRLKLKPIEPEPLFFKAELTLRDTVKIVILDTRGKFVIEKSLTKTEAQIFRARGRFNAT